jgi:hypothetical protein
MIFPVGCFGVSTNARFGLYYAESVPDASIIFILLLFPYLTDKALAVSPSKGHSKWVFISHLLCGGG